MRQSSCPSLYPSSASYEYLLHSTFSNAPMRLHIKLAAGRHLRKTSPKTSPSGKMETKCNRHDQLVWSRWLTAFTTQWSTVYLGGNPFTPSAALPHEFGVCACPFLIYSITNWNLCTNVYLEKEMPTKVGCKSQQKICQFHNAADSRNSWRIEELYRWSLAPMGDALFSSPL